MYRWSLAFCGSLPCRLATAAFSASKANPCRHRHLDELQTTVEDEKSNGDEHRRLQDASIEKG
jgi:hypothetical protein